jgi:hypothetical protein
MKRSVRESRDDSVVEVAKTSRVTIKDAVENKAFILREVGVPGEGLSVRALLRAISERDVRMASLRVVDKAFVYTMAGAFALLVAHGSGLIRLPDMAIWPICYSIPLATVGLIANTVANVFGRRNN